MASLTNPKRLYTPNDIADSVYERYKAGATIS